MNYQLLKVLIDGVPECADPLYMRQSVPKEVIEEVYKRDNCRCAVCSYEKKLRVHHIKPDGESTPENLFLLCSDCEQHVLRGVFASILAGKGFDALAIQAVLGWKSVKTADEYIRISPQRLMKMMKEKW